MKLACEKKGKAISLQVYGEIDDYTFPIFQKELQLLDQIGTPELHIDLSESPFINITGIRLMANTYKKFLNDKRKLTFTISDDDTKELIELISNHKLENL